MRSVRSSDLLDYLRIVNGHRQQKTQKRIVNRTSGLNSLTWRPNPWINILLNSPGCAPTLPDVLRSAPLKMLIRLALSWIFVTSSVKSNAQAMATEWAISSITGQPYASFYGDETQTLVRYWIYNPATQDYNMVQKNLPPSARFSFPLPPFLPGDISLTFRTAVNASVQAVGAGLIWTFLDIRSTNITAGPWMAAAGVSESPYYVVAIDYMTTDQYRATTVADYGATWSEIDLYDPACECFYNGNSTVVGTSAFSPPNLQLYMYATANGKKVCGGKVSPPDHTSAAEGRANVRLNVTQSRPPDNPSARSVSQRDNTTFVSGVIDLGLRPRDGGVQINGIGTVALPDFEVNQGSFYFSTIPLTKWIGVTAGPALSFGITIRAGTNSLLKRISLPDMGTKILTSYSGGTNLGNFGSGQSIDFSSMDNGGIEEVTLLSTNGPLPKFGSIALPIAIESTSPSSGCTINYRFQAFPAPENVTLYPGEPLMLSPILTAQFTNFIYQWRLSGLSLNGQTNYFLLDSDISADSAGFYELQITGVVDSRQVEWILPGTQVRVSSAPQVEVIPSVSAGLSVKVHGIANRAFFWQESEDLKSWKTAATYTISPSDGSMTIAITNEGLSKFYRAAFEPPVIFE